MAALEWSQELALDNAHMDSIHQEFVTLLAEVECATDSGLLSAWQSLVEHTEAHFGQEDRWMVATRFFASNCHTTQHDVVLGILRQGTERGVAGDLSMIRQLVNELATWFPMHAQSMDTALAGHLQRVGYDPITGQIAFPGAMPKEEIDGCGDSTCSDTAGNVAATH